MISYENADASLDESKDRFGRTIAAADGLAETLQQSAVRVRNETTGSFVTQTMDCSVGQIEGLICSKPFGKTLSAFLDSMGCSKAASLVA